MKILIREIALVALSLLTIVSCRPDGTRRENGEKEEEEQKEDVKEYVENPNWTITYNGREVDTENGVYVVDPVYLKSSDNVQYFLDVISLSTYKRTYNSNIQELIEGDFRDRYDASWVTSGDSRSAFDALDAGDGNWVAIAYEITGGKLGTKYAFCQFQTKAITMKEDQSYEISYNGREKYTEDDTEIDVENISIKSYSDYSYYVDIAYPEYITEYYDGDPVAFFNDVLDYQASTLSDGEDFQGIIYSGDHTILFDRLRHGDWTAYAFGVDYLGNLTGNWSKLDFDIDEEEATEEFSKWLGTWKIGSGNYHYNITITSSENNQYYAIQDWETGDDADDFANSWASDYVFESQFDPGTGNMIFNSQYLGSSSDDEIGDYDVCLLGNIEYDGEAYALTDIDFPLADAVLSEDSNSANVNARHVTVSFDNKDYTTTFTSMQYYDLTDEYLYYYNEVVPAFPMTMAKVSGDDGAKASAIRRPRAVRKVMNSGVKTANTKDAAIRHCAEGQAIRRTMSTNAAKPSIEKATRSTSAVTHHGAARARRSATNRSTLSR